MRHLAGLSEIADAYDGFIVDLWGVVHDGVRPLPGAADCLAAIAASGRRVVLLSNAPRRAEVVAVQLARMGIDDTLYAGLVTSGEITRSLLVERRHPFFASLGRRVWVIGPARDRNLIEGLDLVVADAVEEADFILNTGPDDERPEAVASFAPVLERAAAAGLGMVCANPDLEVVRGGVRVICAGTLAVTYRALGGAVCLVGKPDKLVYAPVLARLGLPPGRVAAIGDSLATDIAGATASGIDPIWVLGGIHAELRGDPAAAEREAARAGLAPVATLPGLVWG